MITDDTDSTNRHHGVYQEYGKANLEKRRIFSCTFKYLRKIN